MRTRRSFLTWVGSTITLEIPEIFLDNLYMSLTFHSQAAWSDGRMNPSIRRPSRVRTTRPEEIPITTQQNFGKWRRADLTLTVRTLFTILPPFSFFLLLFKRAHIFSRHQNVRGAFHFYLSFHSAINSPIRSPVDLPICSSICSPNDQPRLRKARQVLGATVNVAIDGIGM